MIVREPDSLAYRDFLTGLAAALALGAHAEAPKPPPAFRYWNPGDTASIPKTLSAMGLYAGAPGKEAKLVPGAWRYEVNSPLWSDDAYPSKSLLLFRQESRNTRPGDFDPIRDQMPPLASFEVNEPAVALLDRWIREMPAPVPEALARARSLTSAPGPVLRGDRLTMGAALPPGDPEVTVYALDGRRIALRRLAAGVYGLPPGLPKGLYLVRAGAHAFLRYRP